MMKRILDFRLVLLVMALFALNVNLVYSGGIDIPFGSTVDFHGTNDVAGDVTNAGTLNLNNAAINLDGDWVNSGTVFSGTSKVDLNSSTQGQSVTTGGASNFLNALDITNSSAAGVTFLDDLNCNTLNAGTGVKQLLFSPAGLVHTIFSTFNVNGASGNLIVMASTSVGSQYNLSVPTLSTGAFLDIKDTNVTSGDLTVTDSTNSGNNAILNTTLTFEGGGGSPSVPGDLNGDGVVNILDVSIVSSCFGLSVTDPRCVNADVDSPFGGVIDINDVTFVTSRFGTP
ncbi:MAG: dockerin type I domain-containing protein [Candidatus Anammoxibacter sp.]